nr:reverse transcriptase domain-containing protein [Tanacetum cinerariifolium]
MAKMFLGKYFPPSMVTKLRNEITNFRQRPDESLFEACHRWLKPKRICRGSLSRRRVQSKSKPKQSESELPKSKQESRKQSWNSSGEQPKKKSILPRSLSWSKPASSLSSTGLSSLGSPSSGSSTPDSLTARTLLSNTVTNPKEDLKGITTRSGTAYQGPTIPTTSSSLPKVVERETDVTKDTVPHTNNESTKDVQPPVVQIETLKPKSESVVAPVIKPVVAPNERAMIDVYAGELTLRVNNEAVTFNLDQTSRCAANYNDMMANQIDVIDMDFDAFLDLEDDPTSPEVDHSYYDTEGDIILLEAFLNDEPSLPPPNQGMYLPQIKSSDAVFMTRKPLTFSRLAIIDPPGDTMARTTPPKRFRTPRAIFSDRGTHFCNDQFAKVMLKYGVNHRLATVYHPQTSGQVEVSNYGLKRILERTVGENRASWSGKLDDTLWAFRIGNIYLQKDKIQAKPNKTKHEMESVEKSKVNPVKVKVKDRTE